MRPGLSQSTQLKQELKINPRLYQAMDLLYMPLLDLQQHLKQELLNNPFLEMVEPEEDEEDEDEARSESAEVRRAGAEKTQKRRDRLGGDSPRRLRRRRPTRGARGAGVLRAGHRRHARPLRPPARPDDAARPHAAPDVPRRGVHRQHRRGRLPRVSARGDRRRRQRHACSRPPRSRSARSADAAALHDGRSRGDARRSIQSLDPPGVGARDLRECLLLQLREAGLEQSRAVPPRARLLRRADQPPLERDLEALRHQRRRRAEGGRRDRRSSIRSRASSTATRSDNYIIPDLIVDKIDGKYHVFLNDANLPRLKLSKAYQEIARDKKKFEGENKEFISNKLNSANWMIQAIEQRRQTMLKVMNYIVDRQREFFEKGVQYPQAADAARGRRSHQHARVHGQPRDEREVRADAARRAAAQVLLLVRPVHDRRRGRLGARHQGADPEAGLGRGSRSTRSPTRRS